jgi:Copper fist DNA binding domain
VRGHRVSNCQHSDRPLQHINKKVDLSPTVKSGRPNFSLDRVVQSHNANIVELCANPVLHMFVATVAARRCIRKELVQRSIRRVSFTGDI